MNRLNPNEFARKITVLRFTGKQAELETESDLLKPKKIESVIHGVNSPSPPAHHNEPGRGEKELGFSLRHVSDWFIGCLALTVLVDCSSVAIAQPKIELAKQAQAAMLTAVQFMHQKSRR